jgi:asparagine synthase (glutamine-hydrolysing)
MCGIAGVIGAIDPTFEAMVRAMMDAEHHRGPDDSGFFASENSPGVMFGFRRLAILDLSSDGHQPMLDEARRNVIVFNGEIYNFAELRRELEGLGETFRSKSDTEVLLKAYGRWGDSVVHRLRGMYAFAIYDASKREVLLVRDRLGIKPLYYAEVEVSGKKVLAFASELRALLATGLFARRIDPQGLATYLYNGFAVGPCTLVRGISLLGPGALMRVRLDAPAVRPETYWSLRAPPVRAETEAVDLLRSELETAARQHLVSDVPLGVFLSGGVDSSAIAALAVRAGSGRVKTFHIGFDEAAYDESRYARSVAESLGTEHTELRLTQARFRDQLDDALAGLDQPTFDAINTYFVSRVVREAGITVALAGTGGDELFGGYRSFRDLPKSRTPAWAARLLPEPALAGLGRGVARLKLGAFGEVPPQTRWGKLGDLLATGGDLVGLYQVAYGLYTREFLRELALERASAPHGLPAARAAELAALCRDRSSLSAIGALELSLFIGERLLRDSDAASMAVSLELRVPLLDHAVVEAAQAVPDSARFQPLGKKQLLKTLALGDLDPAIFDRPKSGFVVPIEVWAKDQLAREIEAAFQDRTLVEGSGLCQPALLKLWRAFSAGAPGIYWSRIWAPYVLVRWCKQHGISTA